MDITITSSMLVAGGAALLALIIFQILVGKRRIKFKGPLHMKVHRWSAYAMLVLAALHAIAALAFLGRI
ncbi:MAG: hypothetical protein ACYC6J_05350 [Coriobacteriia bacterium]